MEQEEFSIEGKPESEPLSWLPWVAVAVYAAITIFLAVFGNEWAPIVPMYLCFPAGLLIVFFNGFLIDKFILPSHGSGSSAQYAHVGQLTWVLFIVLGSLWQFWLWSQIRKFINKRRS